MDANSLVADVAYRMSECIFIYPISPATPLAEYADGMHSKARKNVLGQVPELKQLQSESGAVGAVHGSLLTGTLSTTFTASQGLLLMIPALYKFAGEELPAVLHVASRSIATHALSIHSSHDDVYACAQTGVAILCSESVTVARANAIAAHVAAVVGSYPVLHFFDGYTVSHHAVCTNIPTDEEIKKVMEEMGYDKALEHFRNISMNTSNPSAHGPYMGPGTFYAATDARKHHRRAFPEILMKAMAAVKKVIPDAAVPQPFVYEGSPNATHVVVAMSSGVIALEEALECHPNKEQLGIIKIQLMRPFLHKSFKEYIPKTCKKICVLERAETETQALLYGDVSFALAGSGIDIIRGSYGLASTDFAPSHANAVYNNLLAQDSNQKRQFIIGITDDITFESLPEGERLKENDDSVIIFGYGSDGSVGASKSLVKIVKGEGDFEYDSYKSGGLTMCNIRLGVTRQHYYRPEIVKMVVVTSEVYLARFGEILVRRIEEGGVLLLNTARKTQAELAEIMPIEVRQEIQKKHIIVKTVDAAGLAKKVQGGRGANMLIMACIIQQLHYFNNKEDALKAIQHEVEYLYGRMGESVVAANMRCAEAGLDESSVLVVPHDEKWLSMPESGIFEFRQSVIAQETKKIIKLDHEGNLNALEPAIKIEDHIKAHMDKTYDETGLEELKSSEFLRKDAPVGVSPAGTIAIRPRMVAAAVPIWNSTSCIQCGQCAFNCPHGVIRTYVVNEKDADSECVELKSPILKKECSDPSNMRFVIKVNAVQCTGCGLCANICPGNKFADKPPALKMVAPTLDLYKKDNEGFQNMEEADTLDVEDADNVQTVALKKPLFAYSGGCAGCGELTYVTTISRLYDNAMIFNATGCSSIYGHGYPCTPYQKGDKGFGFSWANSLFEDNAEFGFGGAVAYGYRRAELHSKLLKIAESCPCPETTKLLNELLVDNVWSDSDATRKIHKQLASIDKDHKLIPAKMLAEIPLARCFVMGGDGWAYDIGFGGLDHVLAECCQYHSKDMPNITIIVLDSQLYSNTGGQRSKATPFSATAKLACNSQGRENTRYSRKDLVFTALQYGCFYASVAFTNPAHMIKCMRAAGRVRGVSVIRCLAPCIDHAITGGLANRNVIVNAAVKSGLYPLFCYDPTTGKAELGSVIPETVNNQDLMTWVKGQRRTASMTEDEIKVLAEEYDIANAKIKRLAGL